jgi:hypothetical protein
VLPDLCGPISAAIGMPCQGEFGHSIRGGDYQQIRSIRSMMQVKKMLVERKSNRNMGYSSQQLASGWSTICSELFMLGAEARA